MTPRHMPAAPATTFLLLLAACGATGSTTTSGPAATPPATAAAVSNPPAGTTPTATTTQAPTADDSSGAQLVPGPGPAHARVVAGGWEIPDPTFTPGAVLTTDASKVCAAGYSKTVREVSESEKEHIYTQYGITTHVAYQYEIDHDISLELGGSNDPANLWPEPNDKPTGNTKDTLENKLHELLCSGDMTLPDAQAAIGGDWTIAYRKYIGPLGTYRSNGRGTTATTSSPTPSTNPSSSVGSVSSTANLDPRFDTCAAAEAAGVRGACGKARPPTRTRLSVLGPRVI